MIFTIKILETADRHKNRYGKALSCVLPYCSPECFHPYSFGYKNAFSPHLTSSGCSRFLNLCSLYAQSIILCIIFNSGKLLLFWFHLIIIISGGYSWCFGKFCLNPLCMVEEFCNGLNLSGSPPPTIKTETFQIFLTRRPVWITCSNCDAPNSEVTTRNASLWQF